MKNNYIEGLNYGDRHPFREEAERLASSFELNTFKVDGIIRWMSNRAVPPQDVLDFWKHIGKRFNMAKSIAAREKEQKALMDAYKKRQHQPTHEQMHEMRSVFGAGETVVDVISGRKAKPINKVT